jgi:hypothetical protein
VIATIHEITGRKREDPIGFTDIKDLELGESGPIDAEEILTNQCITIYSLDFDHAQAVFVETPPEVNLSLAPFFYQAQYENALHVLTIPFETMIQLAQRVSVDDSKLIMIYSLGRAGSTLASQIFAQVEGIVNISEPDVLTLLVIARYSQPDQSENLKILLDACVRLLCKTPSQAAWVIKGRSWVLELGDWLHDLYPQTKNLFLYRDAETWLKSMIGAFADDVERTPEQQYELENNARGWLKLLTPGVARYDATQHLSVAGLCTLMWLSIMERYMEFSRASIQMLAIQYASWKQAPLETATSMLDYCGCCPTDMTVIAKTLRKDSQAGTSLSQENVKKKATGFQFFDLVELNRHLKSHAYIQTPDFEVANTLKV